LTPFIFCQPPQATTPNEYSSFYFLELIVTFHFDQFFTVTVSGGSHCILLHCITIHHRFLLFDDEARKFLNEPVSSYKNDERTKKSKKQKSQHGT
jgi:hypothetical protein